MQSLTKSRVVLDIELVYDFWSLLFCAARQVISNHYQGVSLTNKDYAHIVNKPINEGVKCL